jgi:hypothetical protein
MTCGHAAQGTVNGIPGCVICGVTTERDAPPDLTGRTARCGCGKERPSSDRDHLAFFEYRGEGSSSAANCECGYSPVAHDPETPHLRERGTVIDQGKCSGYRPRGDIGTDSYYCGCRGWD